jgi:hypothetical protein
MLQARAFLGGYMPVALHIQSTAPSTPPPHKNTRLTVSLQHPINPTRRLFVTLLPWNLLSPHVSLNPSSDLFNLFKSHSLMSSPHHKCQLCPAPIQVQMKEEFIQKISCPTGRPTWEKLYISVAHLVYCFLPIRLTNAAGARSAHRECFLRNLLKNYQMCLIGHPLVLCRSSKSWKQFLWVDRGWCSLCARTVRNTNNHLHTYIQPTRQNDNAPTNAPISSKLMQGELLQPLESGGQQERFLTLDKVHILLPMGAVKLPRRISRTIMALRKASRRYSNEFTGACSGTLWPPFMAPSIPEPFGAPKFVEDKPLRLGCLVTKIPSGQRICSHFPWESTS